MVSQPQGSCEYGKIVKASILNPTTDPSLVRVLPYYYGVITYLLQVFGTTCKAQTINRREFGFVVQELSHKY